MITTLLDMVSWALLLGGSLFVFTGGVGALRMPDFYTRAHAASLTDSLGTILVLTGAAIQTGWDLSTVKLAMVLAFLLFTSPTGAYALANAARQAGVEGGPSKPAGQGERA